MNELRALQPRRRYMELAIAEMDKCSSFPRVGAVIANDAGVISQAFRHELNQEHAERIALSKARDVCIRGAILYTTMESCVDVDTAQTVASCTALILQSDLRAVCLGMLDPNGRIYAKGMEILRKNGVQILHFAPSLRAMIESRTFRYESLNHANGSGSRRLRKAPNGKRFTISFSRSDERSVSFRISPLNNPANAVDIVAGRDEVRYAEGCRSFADIRDPGLYHDPSRVARIRVNDIAIVAPQKAGMYVLVTMTSIDDHDLTCDDSDPTVHLLSDLIETRGRFTLDSSRLRSEALCDGK